MPLPKWKIGLSYFEHIQHTNMLIGEVATAQRESDLHELYSEILFFFCKSFKKPFTRLSCIPQAELGHQFDPPDDGENFRVEPVITRAFLRDVVDPVDALELVLVEPESRRTSAATTAAGTTATGNAEEGAARGKKNTKVDIQWRRPDFLVMVRFFSREGWTRGTLSFNLDSKQPILLVELKIDVYCHVYDEKDFAPRRNVFEEIRKAVPQVLLQAQFAFSEYPALEKIHALIAVGTFCCDFSVSRARLPSLKETGLLFEPAKKGGPKTNAEDFLGYAEGMSKVYHIMNRDGTDFSTGFKRAWAAARSIHSQLKSY